MKLKDLPAFALSVQKTLTENVTNFVTLCCSSRKVLEFKRFVC